MAFSVCLCVLCLLIYRGCGSAPGGARVAGVVTVGAQEAGQILARAFQ